MVTDLFERNAGHAGQLQAVDVIAGLMQQASINERAFKGAEELVRLSRHGITPLAILTELCATTLYLEDHPRAVPTDLAWDYALSHAVFKLAPRPRRMTRKAGTPWPVTRSAQSVSSYSPKARTSALRYVGRFLRQSLAPLLANVVVAYRSSGKHLAAQEAALNAPFKVL